MKDSGHISKMTSSCKWPITPIYTHLHSRNSFPGQQNESVGSLSKHDGDIKENDRKAIGLALHVHHSFLDNSLPSLHDYQCRESA